MYLCNQCPNMCQVNRETTMGKCHSGSKLKIARSALHFWEEPIISGTQGSGTIFFCGCTAKCVFCQNHEISQGDFGKEIEVIELVSLMKKLESEGAHNINFVNPTHYRDKIIEALKMHKPTIPIIYNTNGYERVESIKMLAPVVDVFLPDYKYASDALAIKYSSLTNYKDTALLAISEMIKQKGKPNYDKNGLLKSGVVIRHLVLPSNIENSKGVIDILRDNFNLDDYVISILFQYTPCHKANNYAEINRKLKPLECKIITNYLLQKGFEEGFIQELSSADLAFVPIFDLTGVE